jgi:hypothetical protein
MTMTRSLDIWLGAYLRRAVTELPRLHRRPITDVLFCVVDHFEPIAYPHSSVDRERRRMQVWLEEYPKFAARHWDSDGVPPQHTWFYPGEAYRSEYLDGLNELVRQGLGEIELHLHHGNDTAVSLRERIGAIVQKFNAHGALGRSKSPAHRGYAFIHGNLALDNSMGDSRLCGVNAELQVLVETGCYADFSMPTAPAQSQTRKINSIYYAVGDPQRSKSHDVGMDARVGVTGTKGLMLIAGPLTLDWSARKHGLLPRIDNAEIMGHRPASAGRLRHWIDERIHVRGRPEWVVVKASCHGAEERHFPALLGEDAHRTHSWLEDWFRGRNGARLHYVTARELYNIVKAAEAGCAGDAGRFRDFAIHRPDNRVAAAANGLAR